MKKRLKNSSRTWPALCFLLLSAGILAAALCYAVPRFYRSGQALSESRQEEKERQEAERQLERDRRAYPVRYGELVEQCSREYSLPPELLFAVIHTESSFRPEAVSKAGAIGLMQIMPETFSWLCQRRGESHDVSELTDPARNIDYGGYYLALLLEYYDGSLDNALSAYNAGIGRVNAWLEAENLPKNGTLHDIPISETASYLTKVHHAMEEYNRIYKGVYTS